MEPGSKVNLKTHFLNTVGLQTPIARLGVIGIGTLGLYVISYSALLKLPTLSVFSRLQIPSPSIGLTRAYWYLIHGQFANAWRMNKLIYIVAVVLVVLVTKDILSFRKSRNTKILVA